MKSISAADLERFLAEDDGKPVVMLNLLRFAPDGGRERYFEYTALARPIVARYGAEFVFVGDGKAALCAEPGQSWDCVALVRYPNRRAFTTMIADPEYQRAFPVLLSALVEVMLQPTSPVA